MNNQPNRKSALRGVWTAVIFAMIFVCVHYALPGFWGDDFVSRLFQWFFQTAGLYVAALILLIFTIIVAQRVKRGEVIKRKTQI
jgi:hypothetical protein